METSKIEQLEKQLAEHKIKLAAFESELQKAKEVQKEKGYAWEECFSGIGFALSGLSQINHYENKLDNNFENKNVAATQRVIKSNLAACMLSHIIEAINKDFEGDSSLAIVYNKEDGDFYYSDNYEWCLPKIRSLKGFHALVKYQTPLLKQYFGIE